MKSSYWIVCLCIYLAFIEGLPNCDVHVLTWLLSKVQTLLRCACIYLAFVKHLYQTVCKGLLDCDMHVFTCLNLHPTVCMYLFGQRHRPFSSFISRGKLTRQSPQATTFEERGGEPTWNRTKVLPLTSHLPPCQEPSHLTKLTSDCEGHM